MAFLNKFKQEFNKAISPTRLDNVPSVNQTQTQTLEKAMRSVVPVAYEQGQKGSNKGSLQQHISTYNPEEGRTLRAGTLRKMYYYNPIVKIAVDTIINTVCSAPYKITVADCTQKVSPEKEKRIEEITNFFKKVNTNKESFRTILEMIVRDLLVLDGAVLEKVRSEGALKEIWAVDSSSIQPRVDVHRRLLGYDQVINNQVVNTYGPNDLIYMMMNPRTESLYGLSPLESINRAVTAFLYSESYNLKYFENNHVPKGILDLGPNVPEDQLDRFKNFWEAETSGKPHRIMVLGGPVAAGSENKGIQWIPLQVSSKDMELLEYLRWLERIILAAFGVTPSEVGFNENVSGAPATGAMLQSQAFKNKAIYPMLDRLAHYFTYEIIYEEFKEFDLKFEFVEEMTLDEKLKKAQLHQLLISSGVRTVNEIRKEEGLDPLKYDEEGNPIEPEEEVSGDASGVEEKGLDMSKEDDEEEYNIKDKLDSNEKEVLLKDSFKNLGNAIKMETIKKDLDNSINEILS